MGLVEAQLREEASHALRRQWGTGPSDSARSWSEPGLYFWLFPPVGSALVQTGREVDGTTRDVIALLEAVDIIAMRLRRGLSRLVRSAGPPRVELTGPTGRRSCFVCSLRRYVSVLRYLTE